MTLQADAGLRFDADGAATVKSAAAVEFVVHRDLAAVRDTWLALEPRAVLTPYQRFDWLSAYCAAGFAPQAQLRIVEIRDAGTPIALLPVAVGRWMGAARGEMLGADISNGDAVIVDRRHVGKITPDVLRDALQAIRDDGTALDLVLFASWCAQWQGVDSPLLAMPHRVAPNTLYAIDLPGGQGGSFIDEAFPHKRRTNIKRSVRRLTEQFGELSLRRASSAAEVDAFHAAFLDQRAKRFRQMGVTNVFARDSFRRLFRDGAVAGLADPHPYLSIHALFAGDTILATCIGTYCNGHYSQYINSTTDGPAAKYTLMGVMMSMLVDELRASAVTSMDMGLGDFDYKTDWTEPRTIYDSIVATSPRGRIMAHALGAARRIKREIKTNPAAWRAARAVMALKSRISRS